MLSKKTIIDQINVHHKNAMKQAKDAVESAKAAGELLLQVKATLPHGTWTDWLKTHVDVSDRQAQRYMAVAQGKSVPLRKLAGKSDTVSVLPRPKNFGKWKGDRWEPEPGCMYLFKENDANYWVHPCSDGSYWFHVCKLYNGSRMNTDGFYRCYTIFGTVDDPNLTSRYYVGTNSPLGWLGVGEVLKSYGLRDIEKSLSFGKKIHGGLERPFGEPQSQNWYWGEDGEWDDREAYFESLIKTADR
jgi:hypothetical protein